MGMYTLREAVTPASINMQQVDMSKMKITEPVDGKDGVCPSSKLFLFFTIIFASDKVSTSLLNK
jgi:hypothetical protein